MLKFLKARTSTVGSHPKTGNPGAYRVENGTAFSLTVFHEPIPTNPGRAESSSTCPESLRELCSSVFQKNPDRGMVKHRGTESTEESPRRRDSAGSAVDSGLGTGEIGDRRQIQVFLNFGSGWAGFIRLGASAGGLDPSSAGRALTSMLDELESRTHDAQSSSAPQQDRSSCFFSDPCRPMGTPYEQRRKAEKHSERE